MEEFYGNTQHEKLSLSFRKTFHEEEPQTSGNLKKPFSETSLRWLALIPMNLLLVGYFAAYDSPQPLQTAIESILGLDTQHYSYFYSLLAVPNIILPLFAGYIVDSLGVRPSMIVFATLVLLGQTVFTFGSYITSFNVMIFGRIVFALGADPLNIAQMVMVNRWFKGKEVAFALSLAPMIAGASKALNSIVVPVIFEKFQNLYMPLGFGTFLCLISEFCAILMIIVDRIDESRVKAAHIQHEDQLHVQEKVRLSDIKKFGWMVWLLVINFGLIDGLTFTLRCFLNDLYYKVYEFTNSEAGYLIAGHYIVMAVISPITGKLIDKYGYRASAVFYNSLLGVVGLLIILLATGYRSSLSFIPLILFGIYVGVDDVAVVPALPLVLKEKYLGTGYGLFYTVVNTVLFILPWTCGYIHDQFTSEKTGYFWVSLFLLAIAIIAAFESFLVFVYDFKTGRVLDKYIPAKDETIDMKKSRRLSADFLEFRL